MGQERRWGSILKKKDFVTVSNGRNSKRGRPRCGLLLAKNGGEGEKKKKTSPFTTPQLEREVDHLVNERVSDSFVPR